MVLVILFIAVFLIIGWSSASANSSNSQIQSTILYVKSGGISATCSSWDEPCELQQALTNATIGDQIWVAVGIYKPGTVREATFQLKAGVSIYGGFAGTETSLAERNWETNVTSLSGDLIGDDGAGFENNNENSYHVVTGNGADATAILDGFTIIGGNANGIHPYDEGGGVYNDNGNPMLINLTISGNFALYGGGMCNLEDSSPTLINVTFNDNAVDYWGGGMYNNESSPTLTSVTFSSNNASDWGGGMYNYTSSPSLTNVRFQINSATWAGGAMYNDYSSPTLTEVSFSSNSSSYVAGGMYNGYSSPSLTDVTFSENTASDYGGGMYNYQGSVGLTNVTFSENTASDYGGGMYNEESSPTLTNVTFNDNDAEYYGGGIYNASSSNPSITNCTFSGNSAFSGGGMYNEESSPTLINVTFNDNDAEYYGGGICNESSSSPNLEDVSFSNNTAHQGGGLHNDSYSSPTLTDVTFTNNSAVDGGGGMYNYDYSDPSLINVTFEGNSAAAGGGICNSQYSSPSFINVTFTGNSAASYGGGMYNDFSSPTLTNVTFTLNEADGSGGGIHNYEADPILNNVTFSANTALDGGGICNELSAPTLTNVILWGNTPNQIKNFDAESIPTVSYSVVQGGCPSGANCDNIITDDPFLGPLADNGGSTFTHALGEGSSAIDAGYPDNCPTTDQRGIPRPIDGDSDGADVCDIGAYEFGPTLYAIPGTSGDCLRWSDACELSKALDLAQPGFQIWAAAGTYKPTTSTDREATFQLITGVAIYGGFAGTETNLNERDLETNITTLSGDIGIGGDISDNSYHVVTGSGVDTMAILDGFTITGGNANDSSNPNNKGGGMINSSGSPTLNHVTFSSNVAEYGGGIFNSGSSPTLTNITFRDNSADVRGGGMCNYELSSPSLTNVTFSGNSTDGWGGGMFNSSSNPILTNVTFSGNLTDGWGGGMYNDSSFPMLTNSIFWGNADVQIIDDANSTTTITYSVVQGGCPSNAICNNIIENDPFLGPLADNGGFTFTHALREGSSAIDEGNRTVCPATDQRGILRPIDGDGDDTAVCDIGAYEFGERLYAIPGSSGNCLSWSNACELSRALELAQPGFQIWAAAGTYKPTEDTDRNATFQLKNSLAIYGGFAGTETSLDQRDWETNPTILSGDIGTLDDNTDNSYHVVTGSGVDTTAILDGFTITGGANQGDITPTNQGGGMYINCGKPAFKNIVFYNNTASYGGGLYSRCESNKENAPTLTNVVFDQNTAVYHGGGIYTSRNNLELTNITFSNNKAGIGGGMNNYQSDPSLTNITFIENEAQNQGGAMANHDSSPILTNVTFSGNKATGTNGSGYGSGMYNDDSRPRLTNVTFTLNQAIINGGAMYNTGDPIQGSKPVITNAIIWGNIGDQIVDSGANNYAIVNYSVIEGGYTGTGNIEEDPFLGPLADNGGLTLTHALLAGSPAIDTGNPDSNVCPTTDQRGYTRPIGVGCDIGAYEYGYTLTVQKEGNGLVDVDPVKPEYNLDELIELTATADPGWTFTGWSGGASGSDNPLTVTMDENKTITATFTKDEVNLTVVANPSEGGSVSTDPAGTVFQAGVEVVLTATSNPGWTFTGWSGDVTSTNNSLTITMDSNKNISANFTQIVYTLSVAIDPLNSGTVTLDPPQTTYNYGDVVTLSPTASPGYTFTGWSGATVTDNKVTIQGNTSITATFSLIEYTLAVVVDPVGSGTVTLDPSQTTYNYGDVVTLTPTASPGYTFTGWSGATVTENKVTIQGNTSITATFTPVAPDEYTLSVVVNPLGKGSVDIKPLKATYQYGEKVTLTALANPGWTFTGWSGDVISTANPLIITMDGNKNITANFTQNVYTLTVLINPVGKGFVNIYPLKATYHYGDTVILFALANPGWTFTGWWGAAYGLINPKTITILGDTIVTANFIEVPPDEYTLSVAVDPVEKGTVDVNPLKATYQCGDEVILTAIPNSGWTFTGWTGDVISTANPLTITMNGNKSITANFTQDEYTLSVVINPEGKGKVDINSVQVTYHYGDEVSLRATAEPGWTFINWSGDASGEENPLLYTIIENTTIVANFAEENLLIFLPLILK
jgi:uncharacterized repeat protein (TIGR02543 family)